MQKTKLGGMVGFTVVWLGQVISLMGSAMTQFALTIWIYQETGQATSLALMIFFGLGPTVLLGPVAGALVDRWNRKLVMMLSDLAAGLTTIAILILVSIDGLELWHLYLLNALAGAFQAFQFPAYSAAITMMVDKKHYARTSGMQMLARSASGVAAPILSAALLGFIGLEGIMLIDIVTFLAAIGALLVVPIPQPKASEAGAISQRSLLRDTLYGFRYIIERPSLLGLQMNFFFGNLMGAFSIPLVAPMILARTGSDQVALGTVQSAFAAGGVVGSLLISTWGGPKRKIHGVLISLVLASLLGRGVLGLGQGIAIWAIGAFCTMFFIPIMNGSSQAIWQSKVPPDVQGRVFAVRLLLAQFTFPVGAVIAAPIADHLFEPAMMSGGSLAPIFGGITGTGPGAGMSLIVLGTAVIGTFVALAGYAFPAVRNAESILPDHELVADREAGETELVVEVQEAEAGTS